MSLEEINGTPLAWTFLLVFPRELENQFKTTSCVTSAISEQKSCNAVRDDLSGPVL
jgi:hypothetical protein